MALGVGPFAARRRLVRRLSQLDGRNRRHLLGALALGGVVGPVVLLFELRLSAAVAVSFWLNLELVATALLEAILFRDHLNRQAWAGAAAVVVAAVVGRAVCRCPAWTVGGARLRMWALQRLTTTRGGSGMRIELSDIRRSL